MTTRLFPGTTGHRVAKAWNVGHNIIGIGKATGDTTFAQVARGKWTCRRYCYWILRIFLVLQTIASLVDLFKRQTVLLGV